MAKRKLIIDCDAGVDDAFAILLALSRPDVDVLAITCVGGNTDVEKICVNVMKVLEVCKRTDIPVYKGAGVPILGHNKEHASFFHGKDGLGDATDLPDPEMSRLQTEHAVDALIRLAADDITLVALGPLTNIALACRLEAVFPKRLKDVVIMGGNCEAKGNGTRTSAEFNFHCDPEAAYICLNELKCPVTIVTWEICLKHYFEWELYEQLVSQGTEKSEFFKSISKTSAAFYQQFKARFGNGYVSCDPLAMSVAINPNIVTKKSLVHATVELHGSYTTGQMVVDWRGVLGKTPTVFLVQEVDMSRHSELILAAVL